MWLQDLSPATDLAVLLFAPDFKVTVPSAKAWKHQQQVGGRQEQEEDGIAGKRGALGVDQDSPKQQSQQQQEQEAASDEIKQADDKVQQQQDQATAKRIRKNRRRTLARSLRPPRTTPCLKP